MNKRTKARSDRPAPPRRRLADGGGPRAPRAAGNGFDALAGQDTVVRGLRSALERRRLPHALLLHGPAGVGKATCAGILAQALNCIELGPDDACGRCVPCDKIARGLHPDVLWIEVVKGKRDISIAQIRSVVNTVGFRPHEGRRRVVVIDQAQLMNASAQNALLKTLEEPPPSSTLVLVTPAPRSLLATVRSRCTALEFRPLPRPVVVAYLREVVGADADEAALRAAIAPGSIGTAIALDLDDYRERRGEIEAALRAASEASEGGSAILDAAKRLRDAGKGDLQARKAAEALAVGRSILRDLLVLAADSSAGSSDDALVNADRGDDLRAWAAAHRPDAWTGALAALQAGIDDLTTGIQPNILLSIERTLVRVSEALAGSGPAAAGRR